MLVKESKEKYDPVFASFGMKVLSHDYAESVRRHNLEVNPSRIRTWIPQAGFQENVLRNDADILIIGGRRGGGKMQPLHSKVLTPCGWTTMGELRLGSEVINPTDGRTQRVTRITDHRDKPIYSVLFSDGTRAECGLEHLWLIYRRDGSGLLRSWVMDLEHILPILSEGTEDMFIPLCSAVEFAPSPRVLAPYPTGKRIALEGAELTEEMIEYYIRKYVPLLRLELLTLIVNDRDELVCFGVALPSLTRAMQRARGRMFPLGFLYLLRALYSHHAKVCDLMLVAARPDVQNIGAAALLFTDMIPQFQRLGTEYAESNPELVENQRIHALWSNFDKVQHKRRVVFARNIQ